MRHYETLIFVSYIFVVSVAVSLSVDVLCRTRWTFGISSVAFKQELARRTEPNCRPFKTTLLETVLKDLKDSKCNLSTELVGSWDSSINHL